MLKKILVIDDSDLKKVVIDIQTEFPEFEIIQPKTCHSVNEAFGMINQENPDIILLDLHLSPEENFEGFEIARILKNQESSPQILSISNWDKQDQKEGYGDLIQHFPGKKPRNIIKCLKGKCDCRHKEKVIGKKLTRNSHLVIVIPDLEFTSRLAKQLEAIFPNVIGLERGEDLAEIIVKKGPEAVDAVLIEGIQGIGRLTHDYGHVDAPSFDSLNLQIIIMSFEDEEQKAKERGYKFIKVPCEIEEFKKLLDEEV